MTIPDAQLAHLLRAGGRFRRNASGAIESVPSVPSVSWRAWQDREFPNLGDCPMWVPGMLGVREPGRAQEHCRPLEAQVQISANDD